MPVMSMVSINAISLLDYIKYWGVTGSNPVTSTRKRSFLQAP